MTTESDPAVTRVTVVLDRADDWHKWLFIRKDTAQKNDLWQYVDPATNAADLPTLMAPVTVLAVALLVSLFTQSRFSQVCSQLRRSLIRSPKSNFRNQVLGSG